MVDGGTVEGGNGTTPAEKKVKCANETMIVGAKREVEKKFKA